ncbi:hypothetical protein [Bacillus sp. V2I10]|nr:hypothetical protein [Bacillus sp. V2I10]MDQ0861674.1 hypothetical protein [Bacillus sp. V2I10]
MKKSGTSVTKKANRRDSDLLFLVAAALLSQSFSRNRHFIS